MKESERKVIRSVYCELKGLESRVTAVLNPLIVQQITKAAENLWGLIAEEEELEDQLEEQRSEELSIAQDELGIQTIMSMNVPGEKNSVGKQDLDKVFYEKYGVEVMTYRKKSTPISANMTLKQLWVAADTVRCLARDEHHVFLEGFSVNGKVLEPIFGS